MKKGVREKFAEITDMPKDFIMDMARITLIGNREIKIENYKGIAGYNDNSIRLYLNNKHLLIKGNNLLIDSLAEKVIFISGNITSVEFCAKNKH